MQVIRVKQINTPHLYRTYLMTNICRCLLRPQETTVMTAINST